MPPLKLFHVDQLVHSLVVSILALPQGALSRHLTVINLTGLLATPGEDSLQTFLGQINNSSDPYLGLWEGGTPIIMQVCCEVLSQGSLTLGSPNIPDPVTLSKENQMARVMVK